MFNSDFPIIISTEDRSKHGCSIIDGYMNSSIWVCLKMGYTPNQKKIRNGIMISKTIGFRGFLYFQTNPYMFPYIFHIVPIYFPYSYIN